MQTATDGNLAEKIQKSSFRLSSNIDGGSSQLNTVLEILKYLDVDKRKNGQRQMILASLRHNPESHQNSANLQGLRRNITREFYFSLPKSLLFPQNFCLRINFF